MSDLPQLYLISPPEFEPSTFPDALARVLDAHEIACFRLALDTRDTDRLSRAADLCRDVVIARDVAIVIEDHVQLATDLGLDGVHLSHPRLSVRDARKALGADAIVGSFCGASRHDGLSAGEAGADYVAFGPASAATEVAEPDLFAWWSEMIEVPVVAEGKLTPEIITTLSPHTDFFGISEIWTTDDPAVTLGDWVTRMG